MALAVAIIVLTVWLAPELTGVVIAKMLVMVGLLLGSALGPPWLQTAIAIGVAAVGIYLQNPGAIWNFADPGNGGAAANSGTNLARWLTVLAFGQVPLGVRSKHDRAMEKKHAAEQKDQGLSRCVRNLLGPWFKELDLSKIVLHNGTPFYVRRDATGYTEGDDIYLRDGIKQHSSSEIALIGHEITHVRQEARFGLTYFKYYAQNSWREWRAGRDPAGMGNPLEAEAYDMEDAIKANLNKTFGSKNPCP